MKPAPPRASRERARARPAAAAETIPVTITLVDVAGQPVVDPETFFTFRRLTGNRQVGDQFQLDLTGRPVVFNVRAQASAVLVCDIDPRRFRFAQSAVFFATPGSEIARTTRLLREPDEWTPRFTSWNDLAATFNPLKKVLGDSPNVTLFKETTAIADLLVEDAYDAMAGQDVTLAKTALLNGYFRLNNTVEPISKAVSWFSFVRRFIAIGRERFLAFVDPEMEARVREIHTHIDQFRAEYERTPSENHRGNVPPALRSRITSMISIKSTHEEGNFQLTLSHLSGPDEVLLDTDIDENGELFRHFLDLFKHKVTGGTHPHDIHELLVLQQAQPAGFDLGYRLV